MISIINSKNANKQNDSNNKIYPRFAFAPRNRPPTYELHHAEQGGEDH